MIDCSFLRKYFLSALVLWGWVSAYGGYVTPEVTRSGKSLNSKPLGIVWQKRNGVGTEIKFQSGEEDKKTSADDSEYDLSTLQGYGFLSRSQFSAEYTLGFLKAETDLKGSSSESMDIDLWTGNFFGGYRLHDSFGLGAGIGYLKQSIRPSSGSRAKQTFLAITLGGVAKWSHLYFGGGMSYYKSEWTQYIDDSHYNDFFLGVGYQDYKRSGQPHGISIEGALLHTPRKSVANGVDVDESNEMVVNFTLARGIFEIDSELSHNRSEEASTGKKYYETTLEATLEFLVSPEIYLGPTGRTFYLVKDKFKRSEQDLGIQVGQRTTTWDLGAVFASTVGDEQDDTSSPRIKTDLSGFRVSANFGYFF